MPIKRPIFSIQELYNKSLAEDPTERPLCDCFGIFLEEKTSPKGLYWELYDESTIVGLGILLSGSIAQYPNVEPGDIVRIHRLRFDQTSRAFIVKYPRDVVVWKSFKYNPVPISVAKNPTIGEQDEMRRRTLEAFLISTITPLSSLKNKAYAKQEINIAGRVDTKCLDEYGHAKVKFTDGTGTCSLRIFKKQKDADCSEHFDTASKLAPNDYFIAMKATIASPVAAYLSANKRGGRCIRFADKQSILVTKLNLSVSPSGSQNSSQLIDLGNNSSQEHSPKLAAASQSQHRRSLRLLETTSALTRDLVGSSSQSSQSSSCQLSPFKQPLVPLPEFTRIADIRRRDDYHYNFYNIIGQVKGKPNETAQYQNYVFQLDDGSGPDFGSLYADQVREPGGGKSVTILVYSPQSQTDTNQHIETVKKLKEGDLIYIKNLKVSWRAGKIKMELNANLNHGKSITIIDKQSELGKRLFVLTSLCDEECRAEFLREAEAGPLRDESFESLNSLEETASDSQQQ